MSSFFSCIAESEFTGSVNGNLFKVLDSIWIQTLLLSTAAAASCGGIYFELETGAKSSAEKERWVKVGFKGGREG